MTWEFMHFLFKEKRDRDMFERGYTAGYKAGLENAQKQAWIKGAGVLE